MPGCEIHVHVHVCTVRGGVTSSVREGVPGVLGGEV